MQMDAQVDRRKNERHPVKDKAFAVLRSKPTRLGRFEELSMGEIGAKLLQDKTHVLGQIIDISSSGLSFAYVPCSEILNENCELDILMVDDRLFIYKVPYHTVLDVEMEKPFPDDMTAMRKRSVKFGRLHHGQKNKLAHFSKNITRKNALPSG
jgi:hypothetical protein